MYQVLISLEIMLTLGHKTQVEFRSYFSGKKLRLMGREIRYLFHYNLVNDSLNSGM